MKLYDLLRVLVSNEFVVINNLDLPFPECNCVVYDYEHDEREVLRPYMDFTVKSVELLQNGFLSKRPVVVINIFTR